ncbi:hypothetical protein PSPO_a1571 [Pseudoalteromonas spongiae UST010723-006]|nr:hypothetical protein PSPO_a1571 [Pseudoalteromonas spongiae UST010723-006]
MILFALKTTLFKVVLFLIFDNVFNGLLCYSCGRFRADTE